MPSIIILTQYYPPETGAPQNRLHSLSRYFKKEKWDVKVVTCLPNYPKNKIYEGYRNRYSKEEVIDSITVYHTWIYVSKSRGVIARLLNYFSFVFTSFFKLLWMPKADFILCESPPLFLGLTAVWLSWIKKSKLVFNVSDLWPESAEKLNIVSNKTLIRLAYQLEAWIYKNAFLISGQTMGIVDNIKSRFPGKNVIWFPNGVDIDFFERGGEEFDWRKEFGLRTDDFILLYAGIIGHAQGLEVILNAAVNLMDGDIQIMIVGDGPEKKKLQDIARKKGLTNVHFHSNIEKNRMPSLIRTCDAYIVPLKKLDLFKGAIPSKLFEPVVLGKPILLGVEGEAKKMFIDQGECGLFFEPENSEELTSQIRILSADRERAKRLGDQGKRYVKENFDRNEINSKYLKSLI